MSEKFDNIVKNGISISPEVLNVFNSLSDEDEKLIRECIFKNSHQAFYEGLITGANEATAAVLAHMRDNFSPN